MAQMNRSIVQYSSVHTLASVDSLISEDSRRGFMSADMSVYTSQGYAETDNPDTLI